MKKSVLFILFAAGTVAGSLSLQVGAKVGMNLVQLDDWMRLMQS